MQISKIGSRYTQISLIHIIIACRLYLHISICTHAHISLYAAIYFLSHRGAAAASAPATTAQQRPDSISIVVLSRYVYFYNAWVEEVDLKIAPQTG
jgi:hypothetical protein